MARDLDATLLVALDARWVARSYQLPIDLLADAGRPIALVFAHR